jgi:hypothetical protein
MNIVRMLGVVTVLVLGTPAWAQLTADEQACQQAASKQSGTFVGKKIKCLVACDKQALKGKVPATDCLPPFGGPTRDCVGTTETKALAGIAKKCALDCPECYAGGDCAAHAASLVGGIESEIDFVAPLVRCDDAASPDGLTKDEAKARQKVALVVGKFLTSTEKCLAKCRKGEARGTLPAGSCVYGPEAEPKTLACLTKVALKALDFVEDPALDAPECLERELTFALPIASGLIDEFDPVIFCGSPSGAFVER